MGLKTVAKYVLLGIFIVFLIDFKFPLPWLWMHSFKKPSKEKIYFSEGYSYKLLKPYSVKVPIDENAEGRLLQLKDGVLTIEAGYTWDGVTEGPDHRQDMRASLVHDALYELLRYNHLSKELVPKINAIYEKIALEDGEGGFRAEFMYRVENALGGSFLKPDKVLTN
jgi:hypothetical protein